VPSPEDLVKIESLFHWIDYMHDSVRRPWGMSWIEIQLLLASIQEIRDWAASDPPIHRLYRYRIDAPLDPNATFDDHLPQGWEET